MPGKSLENMHVAVLAGGHSAEREISLNSGKNVVVALKEAGYTSVELLDTAADDFMVTMATGGFDVAFIAMHGAGGEDGAMQGAMETLGIPYTASGVLASACGADKEVSKLLYAKAGIPIAPGLALEAGDEVNIDRIVEICGERCFVKPAVNGSSYGISLVHEPSELPAAIAKAFEYGDKVLVEKCIVCVAAIDMRISRSSALFAAKNESRTDASAIRSNVTTFSNDSLAKTLTKYDFPTCRAPLTKRALLGDETSQDSNCAFAFLCSINVPLITCCFSTRIHFSVVVRCLFLHFFGILKCVL